MSVTFRFPGTLEASEAETALLWEEGCRAVVQEGPEVVAYFEAPVDLPLEGRWEEVTDYDWVADYYAGLGPVEVGPLVVAPTHREVTLRPGQRVLWLDPGMAFGTGHHATTHLALAALGALDLSGKRVLDMGAGSGILAIAADLLGAEAACGLDIDPATLPVARANAALNRSRARFGEGSLGTEEVGCWDVIVANLFAELHAELAPAYARALRPGGSLLVTGILAERLNLVLEAFEGRFEHVATKREAEWALVHARKPERA